MSKDKDTVNKKNNINIKWEKWTKGDSEGEKSDYTEWILFNPSPATIKNLHNKAKEGNLKIVSFHNSEYKLIFPHCVTLSNVAFALLIKAGVVNNTLNKNWPLDYNSEGKPFTKPNYNMCGNTTIALNRHIY